jgi:hypothetical protein
MSTEQWMVYDPYDGVEMFDTEEEALAQATAYIESYLEDTWNEEVEHIVVARVAARPVRHVVHRRSDMTADEWGEKVGRDDVDEIWEYRLVTPDV